MGFFVVYIYSMQISSKLPSSVLLLVCELATMLLQLSSSSSRSEDLVSMGARRGISEKLLPLLLLLLLRLHLWPFPKTALFAAAASPRAPCASFPPALSVSFSWQKMPQPLGQSVPRRPQPSRWPVPTVVVVIEGP